MCAAILSSRGRIVGSSNKTRSRSLCITDSLTHQPRQRSMRDYFWSVLFSHLQTVMRIHHGQFEVRTNGKGTYEMTDNIQGRIDKCSLRSGTVTVFVQHTSCSVIVMENADPTARRDLEEFFNCLVPEDAEYFTHGSDGSDDMLSHIRIVLTRSSETIPIVDGKMQLGTCEGIFFFQNRGHPPRLT